MGGGRRREKEKKTLRCVEIMRSLDLSMFAGEIRDDGDRSTNTCAHGRMYTVCVCV